MVLNILLCAILFLGISYAQTGLSCSNPTVIPANPFSSSDEYEVTVNTQAPTQFTQIFSLVGAQSVCGPNPNAQKVHWLSWTPTSDTGVYLATTKSGDTSTWNTNLIFARDKDNIACNAGGWTGNSWICETRYTSSCGNTEYPIDPIAINVKGGVRYYIALWSESNSAPSLYLRLTKVQQIFSESWDSTPSGSFPTGWSQITSAPRGWYVGTLADINTVNLIWDITLISTSNIGGLGSNIIGLNPYRNDPISQSACTVSTCNNSLSILEGPTFGLSSFSSAVLVFETFFYDGTSPSYPTPSAYAYIEIFDGTWNRIYTLSGKNFQSWYTEVVSLNNFVGKSNLKFRFYYESPKLFGNDQYGWLINNVLVTSSLDYDLCSDSYLCTNEYCFEDGTNPLAIGRYGCFSKTNDSYCDTISVSCNDNVCDPIAANETEHGCTFTEIVGGCSDGRTCTDDYCSVPDNGCVHVAVASKCNDGRGCTNDFCLLTNDTRTPTDAGSGCLFEQDCDDFIACTVDTCETTPLGGDKCLHTVDYNLCEDFIDCTYELLCDTENPGYDEDAGCIRIEMHEWCSDDDPCTIDYCDPTLGLKDSCVHEEIDCDDDIACTIDYCDEGSCVHVANNTHCDDGISCTYDYCDSDLGCANFEDDSWCSDAGTDPCQIYYCRPGTSLNSTGCIWEPVECDDDIQCTVDACVAGVCTYTANNTLCDDFLECTDDVCDVSLGKCTNIPNHAHCNDSDPCTIDFCDIDGTCASVPKDCSDELVCTDDSCDALTGLCKNVVNHTNCDDGYNCTIDTCDIDLGKCTNFPDNSYCAADGDACFDWFCNPPSSEDASGCYGIPITCEDEIACTVDICEDGVCNFLPVNSSCDDGFNCTNDRCDATRGCVNEPDHSKCDDGDACTTDYCEYGNCVHEVMDCHDEIACTEDYCSAGECQHEIPLGACDDGIECTNDFCDLDIGRCVNAPQNSFCSDDVDCTEDICSVVDGECIHITHDNLCEDSIACTIDTCSFIGCVFTEKDSLCNDGVGCTRDYCNKTNGGCQNEPVNSWCNDGVSCTTDTCDGIDDCQHALVHSVCDDGIDCTDDSCTLSGCEHEEVDEWCSDGVGCTVDRCNGSNSVSPCSHTATHSLCDDGFACSTQSCNALLGCQYNYSSCPWDNAGDLCINCHSAKTSITQQNWKDGSGALAFNVGDNSDQETALLLTPTNQFIVGAASPSDVRLGGWDGFVVNDNLRLVPLSADEDLPPCNEVRRGQIIVKEVEEACGPSTCQRDVVMICVKHRAYEWAPLAEAELPPTP